MSWGVATQNGVSVSLASIVSLSCGATEFSPASLFTSGVAGAWYDPSDYSTLFQDSAGTTPVTAVEQPVGLMLDKSQGLVLGSELVTNGDFSSATGWTLSGAGVSITGGQLVFNAAGATQYAFQNILTVDKWYVITYTISGYSTGNVRVAAGGSNGVSRSANGTYTEYVQCSTNGNFYIITASASNTANVDNVSVKQIAGNHASQATSASRPILRARYNLLTYSEQFDNAGWSRVGATVTANTATAPDGTVTADTITGSTGTNAVLFPTSGYTALAGNLTVSTYIKAGTADYAVLSLWAGSGTTGVNFWVNVQTGAVGSNSVTAGYTFVSGSSTAVGNGWYRVVLTGTVPAGAVYFSLRLVDGDNAFNYTNTVGKTLFVWGADLRTGSSAGTYQRIAAATDYATAGFLPYLYFDGSDDYLVIANTNDLNFGQGSFWAQTGLTSLGASQYDVVWGKNSASNDNIRLFLNSTDSLVVFWGNDSQSYTGSTSQITKNTAQIQEWGINSSGPTAFYALNGTENTPAITLSGTGSNSAPAYIGISNNLAIYQTQMNLYGMILRKGTLPTAAQRTESRNWMAAKSGAVL